MQGSPNAASSRISNHQGTERLQVHSKAQHPSGKKLQVGSETTGKAAYNISASHGVSCACAAWSEKWLWKNQYHLAFSCSCILSICSSDRIVSINNDYVIKELSHCFHQLLPTYTFSQSGWSSPLYPHGRPVDFYLCLTIRLCWYSD